MFAIVRQSRTHGHATISDTSTHRRKADQLPGCPGVGAVHPRLVCPRGVDCEPCTPASGGASRQEATPKTFLSDDLTPASLAATRQKRLVVYESWWQREPGSQILSQCAKPRLRSVGPR